VINGVPATPEDEADVVLRVSITDVRNKAGLTDYVGEVQLRSALTITDRANGAAATEPATGQSVPLPVMIPCAVTPDTGIGSTCSLTSTLDAVIPGIVDESARAVWEMGQISVLDGGPDGDVDTPGNTVFARQGVFVP
jgi:hypothetical protein